MTTLRYQKATSARAETVAQSALQAIADKADKILGLIYFSVPN